MDTTRLGRNAGTDICVELHLTKCIMQETALHAHACEDAACAWLHAHAQAACTGGILGAALQRDRKQASERDNGTGSRLQKKLRQQRKKQKILDF